MNTFDIRSWFTRCSFHIIKLETQSCADAIEVETTDLHILSTHCDFYLLNGLLF